MEKGAKRALEVPRPEGEGFRVRVITPYRDLLKLWRGEKIRPPRRFNPAAQNVIFGTDNMLIAGRDFLFSRISGAS
jgi:hypothetical protein